MTRLRVLIWIATFVIIGVFGTIAIFYARGYRIQPETLTLGPTGLLVVNSDPKAAQVFVDGELKTATDSSISLSPGEYQLEVKKDGYLPWEKTILIEKEAVTQVDAFLVSGAPSLTALTFSGAINPIVSQDFSKIVYTVPPSEDNIERAGLWVMETVNLPLGFNRDPRRITDVDLTEAQYELSPDGRQVLLTIQNAVYLLNVSEFTPRTLLINVSNQLDEIRAEWDEVLQKRLDAKLSLLPEEIEKIFVESTENISFSPDENRILYTATAEAAIPEGLVRKLPGSSTQTQERSLVPGKVYVYDTREDRNFAVGDENENIYWLSNSLNLMVALEDSILVLDYDGTNRKTVFAGNYTYPNAYPSTNVGRLLILTGFGATDSPANLYWLSLK